MSKSITKQFLVFTQTVLQFCQSIIAIIYDNDGIIVRSFRLHGAVKVDWPMIEN